MKNFKVGDLVKYKSTGEVEKVHTIEGRYVNGVDIEDCIRVDEITKGEEEQCCSCWKYGMGQKRVSRFTTPLCAGGSWR